MGIDAFENDIFLLPKRPVISSKLFREYYKYQSPGHMYKNLNSTKTQRKNKNQVDLIKSALIDLRNKIEKCLKMKKELNGQLKP